MASNVSRPARAVIRERPAFVGDNQEAQRPAARSCYWCGASAVNAGKLPAGVIRWGNLPVPYVAAWSSEQVPEIRRDPLLRQPAVFRDGCRGRGRPVFGKMDEARSRRVVLENRCQVCARRLVGCGYVCDKPYGELNGRALIHEPPACERCFRLTLALCPGVARLRAMPSVIAARVWHYDPVAVTLGTSDSEGADVQLNELLRAWKGAPVIGYVRPALASYERIDLSDFGAAA